MKMNEIRIRRGRNNFCALISVPPSLANGEHVVGQSGPDGPFIRGYGPTARAALNDLMQKIGETYVSLLPEEP